MRTGYAWEFPDAPLTGRELRILRLLEKDFMNKEIARQLVITTGTVRVHNSNVYRKLCVNNRLAAVSLAWAFRFLPQIGLLSPCFSDSFLSSQAKDLKLRFQLPG